MELLQHEEKAETTTLQTQAEEATPETAPIARLQKAIERRRRNVKFANNTGWAAVVAQWLTIPLLCYFTVIASERSLGVELFTAVSIWAGSFLVAAAVSICHTWLGKRELERAIMDLTDRTDGSAIGPLIDVVAFYSPYNAFSTLGSDYRAYQAAVGVLTPLLPLLLAEDNCVMSQQQCRHLPQVLKHVVNPGNKRRYNIPFSMALINALEEFGDSTAIPILSRLAKMTPRDEEQRLLREAVEKCLSHLRERDQEVDQQKSLLRASSSIPTDTLLRAATGTSTTDPMQLLRPGQKDQ